LACGILSGTTCGPCPDGPARIATRSVAGGDFRTKSGRSRRDKTALPEADAQLGYHLVNLLLHCLSALLLMKILRRLEIPGAWLAAAIFALHPVQVESVAWISELKNTLSGVFYFGSGLVYLEFDRNRKLGPYLTAFALFLLGLLSKTVIATLPAALSSSSSGGNDVSYL
jgi:hypothetical protein